MRLTTFSSELQVALLVLAAWRLTHLFVEEDGPWDVVARLRRQLGGGVLGRAMDCFYCFSLWIAAPLGLLIARDVTTWVVAWLSIAGGACLLQRASDRGEGTGEAGGGYVVLRTAAPGAASDDHLAGARGAAAGGAGDRQASEREISR